MLRTTQLFTTLQHLFGKASDYKLKALNPIKYIIAISLLLYCFIPKGMTQTDFSIIEEHVKNAPDSIEFDITKLINYLIIPATSKKDKVVSIYQWLIRNIKYDRVAYRNGNKRINRSNQDILKRKKAICWGYSTLFKAMCAEINIPCEVISGYGRITMNAEPDLESPNHAWNSVKIDSIWYLLDATWDSGGIGGVSDFEQKYGHNYFLTPPKYFLVNHLPADPNWQLLECPIIPEEYKLPAAAIVTLAEREGCAKTTKLSEVERMQIQDKRLMTAIKAYEYNPTKMNRRELAFAHLDYEAYLTEISERLQLIQNFDSLLMIQAEMIQLCETAAQLTDLFDTQKENCAYNFFNYAVALTQVASNVTEPDLQKWMEVVNYLENAQIRLKALPQNMFTENALERCVDYITYAKSVIKELK